YLELLRLPAVFTAMADVLMGVLVAGWTSDPANPIDVIKRYALGIGSLAVGVVLLTVTSGCLYLAGMVLNDFFDQQRDVRERPSRPIPSGRVAARAAGRLGLGLLLAGMLAGIGVTTFFGMVPASPIASTPLGALTPALVAFVLAACVVFYDAWL